MTCPETRADRCAVLSPLLDRARAAALLRDNRVTLLEIGDEALVALVHLIRASRASIDVQMFIWGDDAVGHLLFRELLGAARRGVRVRIIADQMFSTQPVEVLAWVAAAHRNLSLKLYNPVAGRGETHFSDYVPHALFDFDNVNRRMHNKLMVVDGAVGVTGGRNFTDEYYNRGRTFNYLDRDVLVMGPAVQQMRDSFEDYWHHDLSLAADQLVDVHQKLFVDGRQVALPTPATPDLTALEDVREHALDNRWIVDHFVASSYRVARADYRADRPGKGFSSDPNQDLATIAPLREAVENTERSLVMQSPYFVLSHAARSALWELRQTQPDIEYVISTNSLASTDAYYVYALSFKRKKTYVADLGFRVFELKPHPGDLEAWMPRHHRAGHAPEIPDRETAASGSESGGLDPMPLERPGARVGVHQKSIVVDDRIAVIGSHNFDPRSTVINTEATLVVRDRPFALELRRRILEFTEPQNSWLVARQQQVPVLGHISGVFASFSRALPLFDLWPFRYTTSFDLREGERPVPPEDPAFYQRYRDVGQFPEVGLSSKEIATRLIGAFGALVEPQM